MIRPFNRLAGSPIASPIPLPDGVALVQGRWIPWIGGLFTGSFRSAAAVTLGDTIVVNPSVVASASLVRHELEHVRQWREDGFMFPIRYAMQYARHGYRANPYEVAARNAENEAH
jgi:hypothetical protein